MHIFQDMERRIHDLTIADSAARKERLRYRIAQATGVSLKQLRNEDELVKALKLLQAEKNPITEDLGEDMWIFLAEHWAQSGERTEPVRAAGKNSFYNRQKAKAYIDTYWQNYNPAYPTFHGGGGDCANFISQVVYAGGMPWVDDGNPAHYSWASNWYCKPGATNRDGDTRITLSWKVAASFMRHWEGRVARLTVMNYKDAINNMKDLAYQVFPGDPIQFCYANGVPYHTLIVTGYAWDPEAGFNDVVLASHTIDSNRRSLYHTMLKYPADYQLRMYVIKEGE